METNNTPVNSSDTCERRTWAWRCGSAHGRLWITAVTAAVLDLASKAWAFAALAEGQSVTMIPGWLHFRTIRNPGAVFGIGSGKRSLFIAASVIAILFIVQLFYQSRSRQRGFHLLLGLTLGGAVGNLYDRIVHGEVRDFIYFSIVVGNKELWPWVFNVADVALVVGVLGLLLGWMVGAFDIAGGCPVARPAADSGADEGRTGDED